VTGRSFYRDGLPVEQALRLALAYSVTASGKNHWLIAAALDMSPSQFSRATTTTPSDESNQRANFPPEKLCLFIQETQDLSWVLTLLDYLGVDSSRLPEIRRPIKTKEQIKEERTAKLNEGIALLRAALKLEAEEAGERRRGR
jgi:hypothetical protein